VIEAIASTGIDTVNVSFLEDNGKRIKVPKVHFGTFKAKVAYRVQKVKLFFHN
jgi:hypothetical protein